MSSCIVARSIEYVTELRSLVLSVLEHESEVFVLADLLQQHTSDFENCLFPAGKDAKHRKEVESGKIELEQVDCSINKDFIDGALQFADFFDIDELLAAKFLYVGTESSTKYDRSALNSAVYVYLATREILLDILRLVLSKVPHWTLGDSRSDIANFLRSLGGSSICLAELCLTHLLWIENKSTSLEIGDKRDRFLGSTWLLDDRPSIERSFMKQHETVSLILAHSVQLGQEQFTAIQKLLSKLQVVDRWTCFTSHHVLSVVLAIQSIASIGKNGDVFDVLPTDAEAAIFRGLYQSLRQSPEWKCAAILAVLQIVLSSELSETCRENPDIADQFDYELEILLTARAAITGRAFQHIITWSLFLKKDVTQSHPFSMFLAIDAFAHYQPSDVDLSNDLTLSFLGSSLRKLTEALIVSLPDLLKEIQLTAEDQLLSQEVSESSSWEENDHSLDLVYGMIYTAFVDEEDSARSFWDDKESNLYGFMLWASFAEAPSTVYAYFMMMSALVTGSACSHAALAFFDAEEESFSNDIRARPSPNSSWSFIFDSLRYYIGQLDRRTGSKEYHEGYELDVHNALILEAYLTLISSVLIHLHDTDSLSRINSKYELLTTQFQLLAQRLPADLYSTIFRVISIFTADHELQKAIWQMFEGWLGAISPETQSAVLSTGIRQRQVEHRPLNSLIAFSALSPNSTTSLIECLAALMTQREPSTDILPFPASLGDNSRYPGASDYVEFVWNRFMSAQSDTIDFNLIQRINLTIACVKFFETSLSTFDLHTIFYSSAVQGTKIAQGTVSNSNFDRLRMHPGTRVMQQLGVSVHRKAILQIIKSHNIADLAIKELLSPLVAAALRLCTLYLDKEGAFEEFIRPLTTSREINQGSLPKDIADDSEVLVHVAMLCFMSGTACSNAALEFLFVCNEQGVLTGRHLIVLSTSEESKAILSGLINLVEDQNPEAFPQRIALLRFIQSNLKRCALANPSISVSHFFLGFTISTHNERLSGGNDVGHIGSGRSIYDSLLDLLTIEDQSVTLDDQSVSADARNEFAELAMSIISLLSEGSESSAIALSVARDKNFLVSRLRHEQLDALVRTDHSSLQDLTKIGCFPALTTIRRRMSFMRYCAKEALTCGSDRLSDFEQQYTQAFFPSNGREMHSGFVLIDWLDVLTSLKPTEEHKRIWRYFKPDSYVALLNDLSPSSVHGLQKSLYSSYKTLRGQPEFATNQVQIQAEFESLVDFWSTYLFNSFLKEAVAESMTRWAVLSAILFTSLIKHGQPQRKFAGELCQALLSRLSLVQENDQDMADIMCESVAFLIQCTDYLEMDGFYHFFKIILNCLSSPTSTPKQREHLYLAGTACLQSIQHRQSFETTNPHLISICRSGADRFLTIICQDAGVQDDIYRITACSFLDLMLKMCEDSTNPALSQRIVKLNLLTRFAYQFEQSLQVQSSPEALSRQFDVLLRLSMTRVGAQDLIRNHTLLSRLGATFFNLEDGTEDASNAIRLLSVYVSCVIALGLQMAVSQSLLHNFSTTWSEKLTAHARRMQKANNPRLEEFEALLQLLSGMKNAPST